MCSMQYVENSGADNAFDLNDVAANPELGAVSSITFNSCNQLDIYENINISKFSHS